MGFGPGFGPGFAGAGDPPALAGLAEALYNRVLAVTSCSWWPLRMPQGTPLPAGVYQRISDAPTHTHGNVVDLRPRRFQLTVYSNTYDSGLAIARQVVAALAGTRGEWSGWDVSCMLADTAEDIDPDDRGLYRQRVDLMLSSKAP